MFCQSHTYQTKNKSEKKPDFSSFFNFQKKAKGVQKKPEHQNLVSKKPNWQRCCTRLENAHKVCKKTLHFCYLYQSRKLGFPFPLLRHYEISDSFYVKNCCL